MSDPAEEAVQMELLCGCWEANLGPPEEQQVLSATESSRPGCQLLPLRLMLPS